MPGRRRGPVPRRAPQRPLRRAPITLPVTLLVALLALVVVVSGWSAAPATAADPAPGALAELREAASGPLEVTRDADDDVVAVVSVDGDAVLATDASTPAGAAREVIAEHGEVLGIDGQDSRAQLEQVLPSVTGGAVVRSQQVVDGLPVLGGTVVTVLDRARDLVSVSGATTRGDVDVPAPRIDAGSAAAAARSSSARAHGVAASSLSVRDLGRWLYDPALVGAVSGPPAPRPVWRFEVTGGDVRESVLVGTTRGDVALRVPLAPGAAATRVCDQASQPGDDPAACTTSVTGAGEVDAAHEHLAETVSTYADLGVDVMGVIGRGTMPAPPATAVVNWCPSSGCTANAFYDTETEQVVLGPGMAQADDVVAHELTHGWTHATAGLFYFQQSGAIDESVADLLGEVVDQRHGTDDDSAWQVGEDAPGFVARSMADPAANGLPDRMTSDRWVDEDGYSGPDAGGVHGNLGVGDKTAHLVSQGGSFNGHTVAGIDAGDPGLARTATLYLETVPQLAPGADYADLGRALEATCVRLAAAGAGGFDDAACASVRAAVAATELDRDPVVGRQPTTVPVSCPAGSTVVTRARDDDADLLADTPGAKPLEITALPPKGTPPTNRAVGAYLDDPEYAVSGRRSNALYDLGSGTTTSLRSAVLRVPESVGGSFLHFAHATSFGLDDAGQPLAGGQLLVERQVGSSWQPVPRLDWRNGPDAEVGGAPSFSGDSRGWGSSQVDLTSLAGRDVRLTWSVVHPDGPAGPPSGYGWWLDDIRLYTCAAPLAAAPRSPAVAVSGGSTTLTWLPPAQRAGEVQGYVVRRSDTGAEQTLLATDRRVLLTGLATTKDVDLSVRAVGLDGAAGPAATARVESSVTSLTAPTRVRRGGGFALATRVVERGTTTGVRGAAVTLQRLPAGSRTWATVARSTTPAGGAVRWTVSQRTPTQYRVVTTGAGRYLGGTSPVRVVRLR